MKWRLCWIVVSAGVFVSASQAQLVTFFPDGSVQAKTQAVYTDTSAPGGGTFTPFNDNFDQTLPNWNSLSHSFTKNGQAYSNGTISVSTSASIQQSVVSNLALTGEIVGSGGAAASFTVAGLGSWGGGTSSGNALAAAFETTIFTVDQPTWVDLTVLSDTADSLTNTFHSFVFVGLTDTAFNPILNGSGNWSGTALLNPGTGYRLGVSAQSNYNVAGLRGTWTNFSAGTGHGTYSYDLKFTAAVVPEPCSLAAMGLGALALWRRRKRCN